MAFAVATCKTSTTTINFRSISNVPPVEKLYCEGTRAAIAVWLYATRDEGVFEKRYDELCEILNIRQWTYVSKISEKLGPSLDELKQFGYLADWRIEEDE